MKFSHKTLIVASIAIVAIQFIQPRKNESKLITEADFLKTSNPPDNVRKLFRNACYDCHSNNTAYPWYTYLQPVGWIMKNHINEGKEELNFSEFWNYSRRKQISKLNSIANSIEDDIMPLPSYQLMHKEAKLSDSEKKLMISWVENLKNSLSGN